MKKLLLLINPAAGRAMFKCYYWDISRVILSAGWEMTVYMTSAAGDATNYIKLNGERYDRIICCGGDGTLNETVTGVLALEKPVEIGYIPAGTTNDMAYSLGIPSNVMQAAEIAANGCPASCDIGRFGQTRNFCYVAGFGIFTDVTYETAQDIKNIWGRVAYMMEAAMRLPDLQPVSARVNCDGKYLSGEYLLGLVCNTVSIAGFRGFFGPRTSLSDGLFELILVKIPQTIVEYQHLMNIMLHIDNTESIESDFLQFERGRRFEFEFDGAVKWTLDGEAGGSHHAVTLEVGEKPAEIVFGK